MLYRAILRCCRYASGSQLVQAESLFILTLQRTLGNNVRACQDAFFAMMTLDESRVSRQQFAAAVAWLNAYETAKSIALRELDCPVVAAYFEVRPLAELRSA
ncbi:MAG: hypothetical protein V4636_18150 [Pseudomonadota bacterium]